MQECYTINSCSLVTYTTILLWRTGDPVTLNTQQFIWPSTPSSYCKGGRISHEWIPNKEFICIHRLLINKTSFFFSPWNRLWALGLETSCLINMWNTTPWFQTTTFWKLELRSLVTFFLQANIYSWVGNWQEGRFEMKLLPNWSLHPNETHGVTMDRVLRTQNICLFVELEETKLFSFVNVNSKNCIFVHAFWWPFLLICLVLLWSQDSSHCFFFMSCSRWGGLI